MFFYCSSFNLFSSFLFSFSTSYSLLSFLPPFLSFIHPSFLPLWHLPSPLQYLINLLYLSTSTFLPFLPFSFLLPFHPFSLSSSLPFLLLSLLFNFPPLISSPFSPLTFFLVSFLPPSSFIFPPALLPSSFLSSFSSTSFSQLELFKLSLLHPFLPPSTFPFPSLLSLSLLPFFPPYLFFYFSLPPPLHSSPPHFFFLPSNNPTIIYLDLFSTPVAITLKFVVVVLLLYSFVLSWM